MGKGTSEVWDEKQHDTRQTQPEKHEVTESKSSGSSCPTCCLRTRDCLMSPECGRALQISSVVAFCGSCIRMWMCKYMSYIRVQICAINSNSPHMNKRPI